MRLLIDCETKKPIEVLDRLLVETSTPTLFDDRVRLSTLKKMYHFDSAHKYKLVSAELSF